MTSQLDRSNGHPDLTGLLGDWSAGPGPLYRKLAAGLRLVIADGALPVGTRLPPERTLADQLAVSRSTVVAAYDELRSTGLLASRQGSGTRVAVGTRPRRPLPDGRVPGGLGNTIMQRLIQGQNGGELISLACAADSGSPAIGPALQALVDEDLPALLAEPGYQPVGLPALRTALADRLSDTGLPTGPEQILVTTGAHQALVLVTELYVRPGDTIVVEAPSWPACLDVFRSAGARTVGVPMDDEGIQVPGTAAALSTGTPALLYLMPTYHNPTGVLMSQARRRRVGELAARYRVPVLEDNAYATATGPTAEPLPPLAAYAPPGAEVVSVGSFSKFFWGGLRIGWVRAPAGIIDRLARRKALADHGSPVLDQALAARLLPEVDRIATARGAEMRRRRELFESLLRDRLPDWHWRTPDGGAALWVALPDTDAAVYTQVALRHGVELVPGAAMDPDHGHDNYLRLPYTFPPETIHELVDRLARAWAELQRHGPAPTRPLNPII